MDIDPTPLEPDSREDITSSSFSLEPEDAKHVALLCGHLNAHFKLIEDRLRVSISNRGNKIRVSGPDAARESSERLLKKLYRDVTQGTRLSPETIHLQLQQADLELLTSSPTTSDATIVKGIKTFIKKPETPKKELEEVCLVVCSYFIYLRSFRNKYVELCFP